MGELAEIKRGADHVNEHAWRRHRRLNQLQSVLLLVAMAAILSAIGWVLAGDVGVLWALAAGAAMVLLNPGLSPRLILGMYGARRCGPDAAPELHALLRELARRAGLPAPPELYYVPSRLLNAFAVGTREHSAIAVTDGLLRAFSPREVAGILAHEVSHVRHNDTWVMGLADLFSRMTAMLAWVGQILLLINLPLLMFSSYTVSWSAILVLVLAPSVSALLQLALSRTREYDADIGAAELTGDPQGLALALARMERYQGHFLEQIFLPGRRVPDPSLLRTHPATEERIRRLRELAPAAAPLPRPSVVPRLRRAAFPAPSGRPRWHLHGMWY